VPWLHEMRWPGVKEYLKERNTILIPVGSTEQHGRHGPLGTDSFVAIQLAEDASKETGVISAPPLLFSWSPHHMVLPGTISIEPSVLQHLLFQMIKSLSVHGFKNFIVVNGHRITNLPWMQIAAQKAQSEPDVRAVIFDPGYMSREIASELGFGPLGHAEEAEISQMLYIRPELVKLDEAVDSVGDRMHARPLYHIDPRSTEDTLCYVPSTLSQMEKVVKETGGSTGKPSKSRADLGKRLHKHLLQRLVEVIQFMESGKL
jgi:creatinine amidohydrolase